MNGLHHQKGAIFGFGPDASDETINNVIKISSVDKKTLSTVDNNVQVHCIGEERNVGMINCKLSIRCYVIVIKLIPSLSSWGKQKYHSAKKTHTHTKKKTSYPLSHAFVEDIIRLNVAQQVDDINK